MRSIFEGIVRHEDDHTELLRNILDRYPHAASAILTYLLGERPSGWDVLSYEYTTQSHFYGNDGKSIPDITIKGPGFQCLVEVKVNPAVPFTEAQLGGYAACFTAGSDNHMCYLVPAGRKDFLEQLKDEERKTDTHIHRRDWAGLTEVLLREAKVHPDDVLLEVATFWERTFSAVGMTEVNMTFLSAWNGENYIAMRRLQRTVEQARKLFEISGLETEPGVSDVREYGFYLRRDKRYELWVGIWADLDTPLLFGIEQQRISWRHPSAHPQPDLTFKNYDLWRLESETWGDPNKLFETVSAFRNQLKYDD